MEGNRSKRSRRAAKLVVLTVLGTATIALGSVTEAWAKCSVQGRFRLSAGGTWLRSLVIRSGDSCEQTFMARGLMMFKRLNIVTPPRQGTLSLRQGGHYRYATKVGAQGKDAFTLRICGEMGGRESCANLVYDVTIQ